MNTWFLLAASLMLLTGLVHSALGERLIFQRLRRGSLVPTHGGELLRERHVRILWATWHLTSVLGWALAGGLCWLAVPDRASETRPLVLGIAAAAALCSVLVLFATRGRHPGWIALALVATCSLIGMR